MRHQYELTHSNSAKALFCDDIPGGVLVACAHCKHKIEDKDEALDSNLYCNNCGKELYYPQGVDW